MATIKDVAKATGVSIATVSRVINEEKGVSEATRKRVRKAMEKLDYRANEIARSLKTNQTNRVAVILPSISRTFFTSIISSIQDTADQLGYSVFFAASNDSLERERKLVDYFSGQWVDGIILASCIADDSQSAEYIRHLESLKKNETPIPVVTLEFALKSDIIDAVSIDHRGAAFDAVSYLIGQGRTKILHVSHPSGNRIGDMRIRGYKYALFDAGFPLDERYIIEGNCTTKSGYLAMDGWLRKGLPFDAVYCANDQVAVGVMQRLKKAGIRIPEDICVFGNDDSFVCSLLTPSLTTVGVHKRRMGERAFELLYSRINGTAPEHRVELLMSHEIFERESTKKGAQVIEHFMEW